MSSKYEGVGSAELISEMLKIAKEILRRVDEEDEVLDNLDMHRISIIIHTLSKVTGIWIFKSLSGMEKTIALLD